LILEKNIKFLEKTNPFIAEKIKNADSKDYEFFRINEGLYCLTLNKKPIVSRINPLKEAEKKIDSSKINEYDSIVILGIGLGYEIKLLTEQNLNKPIIVLENDINIFKYALNIIDLENMLSNNVIEIILPEDPSLITQTLKLYNIEKPFIIINRQTFEIYKEYYQKALDSINKYIETRIINKATLIRFEKLWLKNVLVNIGYYLYHKGVNSFFQEYNDKPVLIVGGGPSISKAIDTIKKIKDSIYIIAVNTSLSYLIKNDVIPDFVITVDPQDKVYKYFIPVINNDKDKLPLLISEPTISPKIIKKYPKKVFCQIEFAQEFVYSFSKDRGILETGGSVVTTAFSFARKAGFNPIMFIGIDMAYTNNTLHFKGSELEKDWIFNSYKDKTIETQNYFFMKKLKIIERPGFNGSVKTDIKFLTYANWLEENFKIYKDKIRIINFSGGLLFENMDNMPLEKMLDVCNLYKTEKKKEIDDINPEREKEIKLFTEVIINAKKEIEEIKKYIEDGIETANKLYRKKEKWKERVEDIKKLDEIDKKIMNTKAKTILGLSIQKAIHMIESNSETILSEEEKKNGLEPIKRTIYLYNSINESCDYTINQIEKALRIVEKLSKKPWLF